MLFKLEALRFSLYLLQTLAWLTSFDITTDEISTYVPDEIFMYVLQIIIFLPTDEPRPCPAEKNTAPDTWAT